jgi:D-lactate dehydrogenase (cytochrome)
MDIVIGDQTESFLQDESGLTGSTRGVAFPADAQELSAFMRDIYSSGEKAVIQGARTGLCGGAVPCSDWAIGMQRMNRFEAFGFDENKEEGWIRVGAGVTLEELEQRLNAKRFPLPGEAAGEAHVKNWASGGVPLFFPPNPTEKSASIGGIFATKASGGHAYEFGDIRNYVLEVEGVLPSGEIFRAGSNLREEIVSDHLAGFSEDAESICGIYAGSEGVLAAITSLTLRLVRRPASSWALFLYFDDLSQCARFADALKGRHLPDGIRLMATDFLAHETIEFLMTQKSRIPGLKDLPKIETDVAAAVYIEIGGPDEEELSNAVESIYTMFENYSKEAARSAALTDAQDIERFHGLWHAAVEACNWVDRRDNAGLSGVFSDLILPADSYAKTSGALCDVAREAGVVCIQHGHIGFSHLHFRLLGPRDAAVEAQSSFLKKATGQGARHASEYGIGRVRAHRLAMLEPERVREMNSQKCILDKTKLLGHGVLLL